MRWNPALFRLSSGVTMAALMCQVFPPVARAQPAPPPLPPAETAPTPEQQQPDPPERVGRVAHIAGTVSFHNQGDTEWSPASLNYPVSSGNAFWTEPGARLRLDISDSQVSLAGGTEFDVATLDATGLQGVAARGESFLLLRDPAPGESWSVQTPRGLARLNGAGRYGIVVGTTDDPTLITALDGSVDIEGPDLSLHVDANQTATLTGVDHFQGSVGPARRDPFLIAMTNEPLPAPATSFPGGQSGDRDAWRRGPDRHRKLGRSA